MSEQVKLNHSADDVYQMRKDWAESFHFDAPADLPGLLDDYDALQAEADALRAENGRLQADRDRANQYANQQALECNKLSTDLEAARGLLREAQSGKSPADVLTMVETARKVITWLDWSGGLPCVGGESMAVDVKSLSFAVDEFDSEELLRKAAALTATPAPMKERCDARLQRK